MSATPRPATVAESAPSGVATPTTRPARFAAFQARNFRLLWLGMFTSNAGTWMASTAEGWLVTDLQPERAPFWLGMIAASFALPMIVLPPFGGAVADRVPRLKLLWTVQTLYLLTAVGLAIVTLSDAVNVWFLMSYAFATGVILAFDSPTRHALLPDLVSREQLTSAVSMNSVAFTGAALVGPAIAGGLIPLIGVGGVFVVNAVSSLATLWALARMTGLPAHARRGGPALSVLGSIAGGVAHVRRSPLLFGLLSISLVSGVFARGYQPLVAVFARDEFEVGSAAFGLLTASAGLGTLVGAFGLASRGDVGRKGRGVIVMTTAQAMALLAFAVTPWYALALPLLIVVGFTNAIAGALTATLIQLNAPNELRGRIMSLYLLTLVGVPSAGSLVIGFVADRTGVREAVGGGALLVVALVVLIALRNRSVVTS